MTGFVNSFTAVLILLNISLVITCKKYQFMNNLKSQESAFDKYYDIIITGGSLTEK